MTRMQTTIQDRGSLNAEQIQDQADAQYSTYVALANLGQAAMQSIRLRPEFYAPLPSQLTLYSA